MTLAQTILRRMADLGIKSNVDLAEKMKGLGIAIHPNTIGKWIAGKTKPRGSSLVALSKVLEITLDELLLNGAVSANCTEKIKEVVRDVAREEVEKLLTIDSDEFDRELILFLRSEKIPKEDKEALLRQVRNLLKLYEESE